MTNLCAARRLIGLGLKHKQKRYSLGRHPSVPKRLQRVKHGHPNQCASSGFAADNIASIAMSVGRLSLHAHCRAACYTRAMIRTVAIILLVVTPAFAWEASSGRVCELTHEGESGQVRVTYDPAIGDYAIAITPDLPWSAAPVFAIRFDGARDLTITTTRHAISSGGATLTVTDRGFGNVLNGLEFNDTATAVLGDREVSFRLDEAGPAVRAFRACADGLGV